MRSQIGCALLLVMAVTVIPETSSRITTVIEYFPEIHREVGKITWAHAANSKHLLENALQDQKIMMIEADIVMGHAEGHSGGDPIPIMAHPPSSTSDLTFDDFLKTVIHALSHDGVRKGIKLDFKDIEAVEPCLKLVKEHLIEDPRSPTFPVFINADILAGPVNATKKPLDAERFLSLAKKYTPSATLSVGWTTRYGKDDPSVGDIDMAAKYSNQNMKDMMKALRRYDRDTFPHITFPVRAALAAYSVDELDYLKANIRTPNSFTLWSPKTDVVNPQKLQSFFQQMTQFHCFLDIPFSIDGHEHHLIQGDSSDDDDSVVVATITQEDAHTTRHHHHLTSSSPAASSHHHTSESGPSANRQFKSRGHSETPPPAEVLPQRPNDAAPSSSSGTTATTILPLVAVTAVAISVLAYRRRRL